MRALQNRLVLMLGLVGFLLLIPLISMQFTKEVNWSPFDFAVMGLMLLGAGLLGDLILRKVKKTPNRILLLIALLIGFLIIWAELAVGIFGSPFAGS